MAADNNNLMPTKTDDRKKDLQQFSGVIQVKKKEKDGFWNSLWKLLLSGRKPKDIAREVFINDAVPAIQDGVYNIGVSLLGKTIYKENQKPGNPGMTTPGSFITNYVNYADRNRQRAAAAETAKKKEEETVRSGFENPAFQSAEAAKAFLAGMHRYVQKYDTISVHDLAWMQQKTVDFTWEKYGWDKEEILAIREANRFIPPLTVDDGNGNKVKLTHYIDMPKAHEL